MKLRVFALPIIILTLFLSSSGVIAQDSGTQTVSQKDYCYKFFNTPRTYDVASVYANSEKEYFKRGEAQITVGDKKLIFSDSEETNHFDLTGDMVAINTKKGKEPLYAYEFDFVKAFPEMADIPNGLTYITVSVEKKKKIITIFVFYKGKKSNIAKMELF